MWTSKGKIQDKNIIDSNIYAKIADNEVVTGSYTFSASALFSTAATVAGNLYVSGNIETPNTVQINHGDGGLRITNKNNGDYILRYGQHGGSTTQLRTVPVSAGTYMFNNDVYYDFANSYWGYDGTQYFEDSVGIGVSNPAYKLNVRNDLGVVAGEYAIAKFERPAGNWTGVHLGYYADGASDLGGAIFGNASKPLYLGDTNDARMVTILNGSVGIGTTTPGDKLEIVGNTYINGNLSLGTTSHNTRLDVTFSNNDVYSATNIGSSGNGIRIYNASTTDNSFAKINFVDRSSGTSQGGIANITPAANYSDMAFIVEVNNTPTETVKLSGDGSTRIGTTTDNTTIEKTGFMVATGSARAWKTIAYAGVELPLPSSGQPDLVALSGTSISGRAFDGGGLTESLIWATTGPMDYAEGTNIYLQVDWLPTVTNYTGVVKWNIDYMFINGTGTVATGPYTISATSTASTAWSSVNTYFNVINGSAMKIGDAVYARLYRNSGDAGDTYPSDAFLVDVRFKYLADTLGARNLTSK